jgi:60 kDa SS-A/Ro ribonucleoprotein
MSRVGLLKPMSAAADKVCAQIVDGERLRRARVHPLSVLLALKTYQQGHGVRGAGTWIVVPQIIDALDSAFYMAFGNVRPTGKRTLLALDVSSSMNHGLIAGMTGITPRVATAAMAMVTMATEPHHYVCAFMDRFLQIRITPGMRLDDVARAMDGLPFGGTDCAIPMMWALANEIDVDTFIIYTDSETWAGGIHPGQALSEYRRRMGIAAKLVVVAMTSNGFSIANPDDAGMLDCVGFDTSTPNVISEFSAPTELEA